MNENNSGSSYLSGFVLGAVIGAGIALLLAPRSGKETRQLLTDTVDEWKDKAQDAFAKGKKLVREQAEQLHGSHGTKTS